MMRLLRIRPITLALIKSYAEEEAPREMCGLLVRPGVGEPVILKMVRNVAEADNEYSVDPEDHMRLIDEGHYIVGVVHSHVNVSARPSGLDEAAMVPGYVYAIYSLRDLELRAWTKTNAGAVVNVEVLVYNH